MTTRLYVDIHDVADMLQPPSDGETRYDRQSRTTRAACWLRNNRLKIWGHDQRGRYRRSLYRLDEVREKLAELSEKYPSRCNYV